MVRKKDWFYQLTEFDVGESFALGIINQHQRDYLMDNFDLVTARQILLGKIAISNGGGYKLSIKDLESQRVFRQW